jgi:hypothetical protein
MIRLIAFAAFALALATSAQAMPRIPLHQPDGITTQVRYYGYGHRRYGYGGYRNYGYRNYGYRHYGYRHYGYSGYNYGYRHYGYGGYRHYGYRPYGYGVARGIARRNIRRGVFR